MKQFIQKYEDKVIGKIAGFDRLVFRGTLRPLAVAGGMFDFLYRIGVLLKDFGQYVQDTSEKLKQASLATAEQQSRPIKYLASSSMRKETIAREIAEADGIDNGLICVLKCVEPCMSYEIYRNRKKKKLELQPRKRKCLHLYHYWVDPVFGFMNARIQTWFPFNIQICMNGREFMARQMDKCSLTYERRENCFSWIENIGEAQKLLAGMLKGVADIHRRAQISDASNERYLEAAKVTYRLRILRAHGIIRKISHTTRYILTPKGCRLTTAVLKIQNLSLEQLNNIAA